MAETLHPAEGASPCQGLSSSACTSGAEQEMRGTFVLTAPQLKCLAVLLPMGPS